jgi:cytoskeletal protein CcmA (bactofilin family)
MVQAAARAQAAGEITTLLGRGATFEGKLTFEGTVRIDGRFKGEVFSEDTLVIGEGAHVEAELDVGEVIIQGTVVGNVKAKRSIEVHAPGRVKGDLHTPSLQIDKGVVFEGRSFMEAATSDRSRHGATVTSATSSTASGTAGGSQPAAAAAAVVPAKPLPIK